MSMDYIQGKYEDLDKVAERFKQRAEATRHLTTTLKQVSGKLINGSWEGKGAAAFAKEMNQTIFPAMKRLEGALDQATGAVKKIKQTLFAAETEAAALFKSDGTSSPATVGNNTNSGNVMLAAFKPDEGGGAAQGGGDVGPTTSGPFQIGPPTPPTIKHDNGFLDQYSPRDPSFGDRLSLAKWRIMLEGSEALRPDLADANAAYRHFLDGNGADRQFDYERYVKDDENGQKMLNNLIVDAQRNVEVMSEGRTDFSVTSNTYPVGDADPRFPYPASENWAKTVGGHNVWSSADVTVTGTPPNRTYTMDITVHAEDRYNFNPGQSDIATGIPDSDNGVFEVTGLAHQYNQYGSVTRTVTWKEGDIPNATVTDADPSRNRRPQDNRRARNRI
jgi:WXG100 family type VII secretion target